MTKKEIKELTDMVMKAEAKEVNIDYYLSGVEFTYSDGNFKFSFLVRQHNDVNEAREAFLKELIRRTRASEPKKNIPKKELDLFPTQTQKHLMWWKDNIAKTEQVMCIVNKWREYSRKWDGINYICMTHQQKSDMDIEYKLIEMEEEKLGIGNLNIHMLASLRKEIPKAWTKA